MFAALVYHIINRTICDKIAISEEAFHAQVHYLYEQDYSVLSLVEAVDILDGRKKAPPRAVLLTFDDGYVDNLHVALPTLQMYHMTATLFVISAYVGQINRWNPKACYDVRHLNWDELRQWSDAGCDIGGHTHTHHCMARLNARELSEAVVVNKMLLEERLQKQMRAFSYPYGTYTGPAQEIVKEHYKLAFAVDNGSIGNHADRYALHRLTVSPKWEIGEFAKRLEKLVALYSPSK